MNARVSLDSGRAATWPALAYADWADTAATLHLWTQVVGKVRLALTPWLNHSWHVPLYVHARGLGTSPMPLDCGLLEIDFDFVEHRLRVRRSDAADGGFALEPMSVATFYERLMTTLDALGVRVAVDPMPCEIAQAIRFTDDDVHASYDAAAVHDFWRALMQIDRVFALFRTSFLGKASPVHLFWGSFDLAVTRFSGRPAPRHPGGVPGLADAVTREAYSHEVSSAGFWPGDARHPRAAFYSYAYPTPPGFERAAVEPAAAAWSNELGEWLLDYDAVRDAADPAATLMRFLQTTYRAAADLGAWPGGLECDVGAPGKPRAIGPGWHA